MLWKLIANSYLLQWDAHCLFIFAVSNKFLSCCPDILRGLNFLLICKIMTTLWTYGALVACLLEWWVVYPFGQISPVSVEAPFLLFAHACLLSYALWFFFYFFWQIFRKEPFFYGHDNHDQLVKIAKVTIRPRDSCMTIMRSLRKSSLDSHAPFCEKLLIISIFCHISIIFKQRSQIKQCKATMKFLIVFFEPSPSNWKFLLSLEWFHSHEFEILKEDGVRSLNYSKEKFLSCFRTSIFAAMFLFDISQHLFLMEEHLEYVFWLK